jgi:hypothetical protein
MSAPAAGLAAPRQPAPLPGRVKVVGGAAAVADWAGRLAALTRAAYTGSDPLPGLPPPDGARDTAARLEQELRSGNAMWLALDPDGDAIGVVRVAARQHGTWEVSRVAVLPRARRRPLPAGLSHAAHAPPAPALPVAIPERQEPVPATPEPRGT